MATAQLIHEKDIVQAVEVWTLDHECNHFKLTSSVYGLNENELASRNESTFEIGTGIVGETAAKKTPVNSYEFTRRDLPRIQPCRCCSNYQR